MKTSKFTILVLKFGLMLFAFGCSGEGVGVTDSHGFGSGPSTIHDGIENPSDEIPPEVKPDLPPDDEGESVGDFGDGFALGLRNGGLIAERVKIATVGQAGCTDSALGDMQVTLAKLVKKIKLPRESSADPDFVKGFYKGYLKAIKNEVKLTRKECKKLTYSLGTFPGELMGGALCSLSQVDISLLTTFETEPLYQSWALNDQVVESCMITLSLVLQDCLGDGLEPELVDVFAHTSCAN